MRSASSTARARDEPTTGLDPEARAEMWAEIEQLAREDGVTVLLTTHDLEEADRLAAQLAIVDRGRVVAAGTPEALKSELRGETLVVELDGSGSHATALEASAAARASTSRSSTARCSVPASAAGCSFGAADRQASSSCLGSTAAPTSSTSRPACS